MGKKAAYELADYISLERRDAEPRMIGNGEYVVVLKNAQYWLWCMEDWLAYRQVQEDKSRRKETGLIAV